MARAWLYSQRGINRTPKIFVTMHVRWCYLCDLLYIICNVSSFIPWLSWNDWSVMFCVFLTFMHQPLYIIFICPSFFFSYTHGKLHKSVQACDTRIVRKPWFFVHLSKSRNNLGQLSSFWFWGVITVKSIRYLSCKQRNHLKNPTLLEIHARNVLFNVQYSSRHSNRGTI